MGTLNDLVVEYGADEALELAEEFENSSSAGIPGICTNDGCTFTAEYEPDCSSGYCEECKTQTVKSLYVLLGII